jgi:glucosamine 6-phosphate synthetase-like amidotransferase/phosphosugar isomerase protein
MCGIIGYIGSKEAREIIINGLKRLEYRGYDSAGMALVNGETKIFKCAGRVINPILTVQQEWGIQGGPHMVNLMN